MNRIGPVPRSPVIDLDGSGIAVAGVDFDQAQWPEHQFIYLAGDYLRQHVRQKQKADFRIVRDTSRFCGSLLSIFGTVEPHADALKINRATGLEHWNRRQADGVSSSSARRELTVLGAVLNHAVKWERIPKAPKLFKPEPSPPRVMHFTPEQYGQLMRLPMPRRMRMFWLLAFGTGARSEAIEELTWDRIHWERKTADYRVPGALYKNKRRIAAPLNSQLLMRLRNYYEIRDPSDPYVIGRGRSRTGRPVSTYNEAAKCIKALGIYKPGMARHVARHTFATWLLQSKKVRIDRVAFLLGDDVKMVERVYGHLSPEDMADDTEQILGVLEAMTA
jgi:integrase